MKIVTNLGQCLQKLSLKKNFSFVVYLKIIGLWLSLMNAFVQKLLFDKVDEGNKTSFFIKNFPHVLTMHLQKPHLVCPQTSAHSSKTDSSFLSTFMFCFFAQTCEHTRILECTIFSCLSTITTEKKTIFVFSHKNSKEMSYR